MATIKALARNLRKLRKRLENDVPKAVAEMMLRETMDNFRTESYNNDGKAERWPDRRGYVRGKGLVNAERYLTYKKLDYKGRLKRSIKPIHGKNFAGVRSTAPYAFMHNEGKRGNTGGTSYRRKPYSTQPIMLGRNPMKRQFMGVGKKTMHKMMNIVRKEFANAF